MKACDQRSLVRRKMNAASFSNAAYKQGASAKGRKEKASDMCSLECAGCLEVPGLTLDMRGGPKGAKRPLERPLDGRVRQLFFLRENHGQGASRNLDKVIRGRKGLGTYVARLRLPFAVLHHDLCVGHDDSMDRDTSAAIGVGGQDDPHDHRPLKIYARQSLDGAACLAVLVDEG